MFVFCCFLCLLFFMHFYLFFTHEIVCEVTERDRNGWKIKKKMEGGGGDVAGELGDRD